LRRPFGSSKFRLPHAGLQQEPLRNSSNVQKWLHGTEALRQGWHLFLRSRGSSPSCRLSEQEAGLVFSTTAPSRQSLRKRCRPCPMLEWSHEIYLQSYVSTFERYKNFRAFRKRPCYNSFAWRKSFGASKEKPSHIRGKPGTPGPGKERAFSFEAPWRMIGRQGNPFRSA
jgi:hypothetical protein